MRRIFEKRSFALFHTAEVKYSMKELEDAFSTGIVPSENKVHIWYDENVVPDKFLDALNAFPEDMRVLEPTEDYAITFS